MPGFFSGGCCGGHGAVGAGIGVRSGVRSGVDSGVGLFGSETFIY